MNETDRIRLEEFRPPYIYGRGPGRGVGRNWREAVTCGVWEDGKGVGN